MSDEILRRRARPRVAILDERGELVAADGRAEELAPFVAAARRLLESGDSSAEVEHEDVPHRVELSRLDGEPPLRYAVLVEARGSRRPLADAAARFALSPREIEVLAMIVDGASNREIAERLHIVEATVQDHVRHLCRKCGAHRRGDLLARVFGVDAEPMS